MTSAAAAAVHAPQEECLIGEDGWRMDVLAGLAGLLRRGAIFLFFGNTWNGCISIR